MLLLPFTPNQRGRGIAREYLPTRVLGNCEVTAICWKDRYGQPDRAAHGASPLACHYVTLLFQGLNHRQLVNDRPLGLLTIGASQLAADDISIRACRSFVTLYWQ
jgi:hypothetical protein